MNGARVYDIAENRANAAQVYCISNDQTERCSNGNSVRRSHTHSPNARSRRPTNTRLLFFRRLVRLFFDWNRWFGRLPSRLAIAIAISSSFSSCVCSRSVCAVCLCVCLFSVNLIFIFLFRRYYTYVYYDYYCFLVYVCCCCIRWT